jgi:hypothetical protein
MQVLFSKIPQENEQGYEALSDVEGNYYYYSIETSDICDDEFHIKDTCGRYIPFPLEELDVLIEALENYRVNLVEQVLENMFSEPDSIAIID